MDRVLPPNYLFWLMASRKGIRGSFLCIRLRPLGYLGDVNCCIVMNIIATESLLWRARTMTEAFKYDGSERFDGFLKDKRN
jgi:hypothetical protein